MPNIYRSHNATEDGNLTWKVTTQPTIEPITVSEVKTYARIDGSYEDNLILSFIKAVRKSTEAFLGRALIEQTITASLDVFSYFYGYGFGYDQGCHGGYGYMDDSYNLRGKKPDVIQLPRPPLISVTEVRTVDEDGTTSEYSSDNYYVRTIPEPGELVLKFGVTPPINTDRYYGGYEIEYKAGYGDETDDIPENIRQGMIMWVSEIYENRVLISEPPGIVKTIMAPERIIPV